MFIVWCISSFNLTHAVCLAGLDINPYILSLSTQSTQISSFSNQIDSWMRKERNCSRTHLRPEHQLHFHHLPEHQQITLSRTRARLLLRLVRWNPAGSWRGWRTRLEILSQRIRIQRRKPIRHYHDGAKSVSRLASRKILERNLPSLDRARAV